MPMVYVGDLGADVAAGPAPQIDESGVLRMSENPALYAQDEFGGAPGEINAPTGSGFLDNEFEGAPSLSAEYDRNVAYEQYLRTLDAEASARDAAEAKRKKMIMAGVSSVLGLVSIAALTR